MTQKIEMLDWKNIFNKAVGTTQTEEASISMPFKKLSSVDNLVQKTRGDRVIWALVLLLTLASLLLVYSSTASLAYRMSKSNDGLLSCRSNDACVSSLPLPITAGCHATSAASAR